MGLLWYAADRSDPREFGRGNRQLDLPVLWDIDFIATGEESYALCEINVNSVSPPAEAPVDDIAATLARRLGA